ncbi:MAG TPA: glycosyltransferase family 4 protein [Candidatus Eisenbacteria bacterium]|jgi:glycosyltransferase involved in cell wall biosynthesis|nr:glycosyltransferase family 4 protein [Candidatus Eisenbacteria bacterium]
MRILLLSHAPVVHTQRWAEALNARGHEVRLLTAEPAPGALFPGRVVVPRFPIAAMRYPSGRDPVRREWHSFRPDVTVAHFVPNYGFLAALAGCRPLFLACWGSDLLVNASRSPFHRARARFTLHRADLIHVDARMLGDAAVKHGASPSKVWVRPWGVDVDALTPKETWEARRAKSPEARILWTRSLEPLYDPETFVKALGLLRRRGVPFRATIAGKGPLRGALESLAKDLEIAGAVRFVGWVGEDELRALYREHEIYVSLSRSDSTSQSLLEAMAAGLSPVVSDIAGNREWIVHREHGLLVPVGDALAVACAVEEIVRAPADGIGASLARQSRAAVAERARFADTVALTEARLHDLAGSAAAVELAR